MKIGCIILIVLGFVLNAGAGQEQATQCTLAVRGTIPRVSSPSIELITPSGPTLYCGRSQPGYLCRAMVSCSLSEAVLTIAASNFKRHRRNISPVEFRSTIATIDLGEIQLQPSELPRVIQVIRSESETGGIRFQVVVHNSRKQDVFVRQATFTASTAGNEILCDQTTYAQFQVSDTIQLTTMGGEIVASGSFQEVTGGRGYTIAARGTAVFNGCDGGRVLGLSLPTAFTIPGREYGAVEFLLPREFELIPTESTRLSSPVVGRLLVASQTYEDYVFRFTTDDDELDIVGVYGTPGQRPLSLPALMPWPW